MTEQQPYANRSRLGADAARTGRLLRTGGQAADRRYVAVVATEARSLARQLRPPRRERAVSLAIRTRAPAEGLH